MAQTTRERIIANRGRRKLSRAQIAAGFGGKRRRSSLRKPRRPHSHRTNARRRSNRRSNSGEIIGYTFAQPARKNKGRKKHMAAKHRKTYRRRARSNRSGHRRVNRMRSNAPRHHYYKQHRRRGSRSAYRRRRGNPGEMGMGRISDIAMNAVFVIAGAVGSKLLAQMVLGSNNTGVVGYAANAIAGGVLWFLAEKVMRNKTAANGVIAGTAVTIILRLMSDYTPFGQYLALSGFGDYQAQQFASPQVLVDPVGSAQIAPPNWFPAPIAAPAGGSGVGYLYGGSGDSLY
jgi:hypothetical protein